MTQSSEKSDNLEFSWDSECAKSNKNKRMVTSETIRDLEEYFSFLEDVAPAPSINIKKQMPIDKVFEL